MRSVEQVLLFGLCERAGERLRAEKQRAGRMEVRIRYSDYREAAGKAKLVPPLQSTAGLSARAGRLLEQALTRRTRVRSLHLSPYRVEPRAGAAGPVRRSGGQRQARLESALDELRRRGTAIGPQFPTSDFRLPTSDPNRASAAISRTSSEVADVRSRSEV